MAKLLQNFDALIFALEIIIGWSDDQLGIGRLHKDDEKSRDRLERGLTLKLVKPSTLY